MQKQKKKVTDFFREYEHSRFQSTILSCMFAGIISLSVIFIMKDVDTRGLLASVSSIANEKTYDADIISSSSSWMLDIVWGTRAEKVDKVTLTLLGDPEKFITLSSKDPSVLIEENAPGFYIVSRIFWGESIFPGTTIFSLSTGDVTSSPIVPSDATFESDGMKYNLTSKGR